MAGVMNGLAVYGGFIPFGGTFLTFVDYMRNAVRLAAMMNQRVIYATHRLHWTWREGMGQHTSPSSTLVCCA